MPIFVLKYSRTNRAEIRELHWNVKMLKLELHEKIIAEINCVRIQRLEGGVGEFGMLASDPGHHLDERRKIFELRTQAINLAPNRQA